MTLILQLPFHELFHCVVGPNPSIRGILHFFPRHLRLFQLSPFSQSDWACLSELLIIDALSAELWRFRKIKKEDSMIDQPLQDVGISSEFTSGGGDFPGPSTSEQSQSRDGMRHSFDSLDSEVVSLKQNAIPLQNNLCETAELVQRSRDNESELEGLYRQKIEAEVEYLTVSRAVKKLRVAAVEQVNLLEEQKKLASEQAQIVKKLGDTELKAAMLKTQAKELENSCEDIMSIDVMLKLQKRICKYSTCFLLQLALLAVLGLFLLQIPYDFTGIVPT